MMWWVLAAWWVVYPMVFRVGGYFWTAHLLAVSAFGLAVVPGLWRSTTVRCGPPAWLAAVALLSLGIATFVAHPDDLPLAERYYAGLTWVAHLVFFLCALAVVPACGDLDDNSLQQGQPEVAAVRRLRHVLSLLLLAMVLGQIISMIGQLETDARPQGTMGNPNILGAVIAAAGLALAGFFRWRPVVLVTLAFFLLMLLLTRSRGAMAAATAMMLLMAARRSWRTVLVLGFTLGALLVLVPNPLWERVLALRSEHYYSRLFFWKVALENIAENPLGVGASMNKYVFLPKAFDVDFPWLLHQRRAVGLTHNVLLTMILEWGWLAGGALLTLVAWTGSRLAPGRRQLPGSVAVPVSHHRKEFDALSQGAFLGAGVLLLELQIDGLEQNALAFSVFLVLAAVCWQRAPLNAPAWRISGRLVAVLLCVVCLGLAVQGVQRGRVLSLISKARTAVAGWANGSGTEALARSSVADLMAVAADDPKALLQQWYVQNRTVRQAERNGRLTDAEIVLAMVEGTQAIEAACTANRLSGKPPAMLMDYVEAVEWLLSVDPLDVQSRWELAREAQRVGRRDLFEAQLEEMFEIEPDDAFAWFVLGRFHVFEGRKEKALYAMCRAREAVLNCRIKLSVDSPLSRAYYGRIIEQADLDSIRQNIHQLRRELLD